MTCFDLMPLEVERSDAQCFRLMLRFFEARIVCCADCLRAFVFLPIKGRLRFSVTTAVLPTVSGSDIRGESVDHNTCQPGKDAADGCSLVRLWGSGHEGRLDTFSLSF